MKRWAKIREWSRLFSEYAAAQAVIQLLGVLAGLWLVNLLPVREYALYTFALSIFTFLSVFSDLGVSSALLFFRRETRTASAPFAPYVRAAYTVRYGLLALGACAGLAFMVTIGRERGFALSEIALIGAVLVAAVWVQVGTSIVLLQLRLEGMYRQSYFAEMSGNAVRVLGVAIMWLLAASLAWMAILAGALGSLVTRLWATRDLSRASPMFPSDGPTDRGEPVKGIARFLLPSSLSAVYFAIQSPLIVWLSAFFAGTESVAQVGALGRLGVIFTLLSGFVGVVLIPRLSAVTDNSLYLRRYLQCWGLLLAFGVAVIFISAAIPHWLLLLLGNSYRDLTDGVLIVAMSAVLATWGGFMVGINSARGWIRHQPIALAIYATIQIVLIASLNLSSTIGVLKFGLWSSAAAFLIVTVINATGFIRPAWVMHPAKQST